ncbi:MAG: YMGG-like glycine zipper-containing protein [Chitinophagaceae bacterium]
MKKLIYSLAFIGVIASCNSKTESAAEVAYLDSLRNVAIIDSIARIKADSMTRVEAESKAEATRSSNSQAESGAYTSESADGAKSPQKPKGLSKAAKGAIIGGVVGAGTGAVIDKNNRGRGAVIGGATGAGVGYTIGRAGDRKSGRVEQGRTYRKQKKETNQ